MLMRLRRFLSKLRRWLRICSSASYLCYLYFWDWNGLQTMKQLSLDLLETFVSVWLHTCIDLCVCIFVCMCLFMYYCSITQSLLNAPDPLLHWRLKKTSAPTLFAALSLKESDSEGNIWSRAHQSPLMCLLHWVFATFWLQWKDDQSQRGKCD